MHSSFETMQSSTQKKRFFSRDFLLLILFLGAILLIYGYFFLRPESLKDPFVLPQKSVVMRVSEKTTHILEPLTRDGKSVDFSLALQNRYLTSTNPGDNGFRDIVSQFGRSVFRDISEEHWFEICRALSLNSQLSAEMEWISFVDYLNRTLAPLDYGGLSSSSAERKMESTQGYSHYYDLEQCNPEEIQCMKSWTEMMEPAFRVLEDALEKPVYFIPQCFTEGRLDLTVGQLAQLNLHKALQHRFAYRLFTGRAEEAWKDVLSMYRLSRLYSQQSTSFTTAIFTSTYEDIASSCAREILKSGLLNEERLRQCLEDLDRLPPWKTFEEQIETERLGLLQCVSEFPEKGPASFRIELLPEPDASLHSPFAHDGLKEYNKTVRKQIRMYRTLPFDWNIIAEIINARYDHLQGKKTQETIFASDETLRALFESTAIIAPDQRLYGKMSLKERSVHLGKVYCKSYIPEERQLRIIHAQIATPTDLNRCMFALECFKREHGHYPETLQSLLETKILSEIPVDRFREGVPKSFIYRRESQERYILYSVGANGVDNAGKKMKTHPPDDPNWDDIAVEMP